MDLLVWLFIVGAVSVALSLWCAEEPPAEQVRTPGRRRHHRQVVGHRNQRRSS